MIEPSALPIDAGLVAGVVEITKRAGAPPAIAGPLALLLGICLGLIKIGLSADGLFYGVTVGLAASGIYETAKRVGESGPTKERSNDAR